MNQRFSWGHININVQNLDASISFYEQLGFEVFIPGIPYLNLWADRTTAVNPDAAEALDVPPGTSGRACIMQLDSGFPKIELTELVGVEPRTAPKNKDLGLVRLCLASKDLAADYEYLRSRDVTFIAAPHTCHERLAEIAVCKDPDGTLIELLQVHLDRWGSVLGAGS